MCIWLEVWRISSRQEKVVVREDHERRAVEISKLRISKGTTRNIQVGV